MVGLRRLSRVLTQIGLRVALLVPTTPSGSGAPGHPLGRVLSSTPSNRPYRPRRRHVWGGWREGPDDKEGRSGTRLGTRARRTTPSTTSTSCSSTFGRRSPVDIPSSSSPSDDRYRLPTRFRGSQGGCGASVSERTEERDCFSACALPAVSVSLVSLTVNRSPLPESGRRSTL